MNTPDQIMNTPDQIMRTPDQKKRAPEIDDSGVIRMMWRDPDPYASPGKYRFVDGSPISMPKKKAKKSCT